MHLHLHHPPDDENSEVVINSGVAEEDSDEVIVTSTPSLTEPYTLIDFFEVQGHTVGEDHVTILIDSPSVDFLDNVEASTGQNTLETDEKRYEESFFQAEGRNYSYPVNFGTPRSTCDVLFLTHLTSVMMLLWL